VVVLQLLA
jgi:hypothetical protein